MSELILIGGLRNHFKFSGNLLYYSALGGAYYRNMIGVSVGLFQDDTEIYSTTTDANGRFEFKYVKRGSYEVRVLDYGSYTPSSYASAINSAQIQNRVNNPTLSNPLEVVRFLAADLVADINTLTSDDATSAQAINVLSSRIYDVTYNQRYPQVYVYYWTNVYVGNINTISDPFPMTITITNADFNRDIFFSWVCDFRGLGYNSIV